MLLLVVRHELAAVACARPCCGGLDLDSEKVLTVFDSYVIRERVSPWLDYGESVLRGLCHELQLYPFAALFEVCEALPIFHVALTSFFNNSGPPDVSRSFPVCGASLRGQPRAAVPT